MGLFNNLKNKIQEMFEKVTRRKLSAPEPASNWFDENGYIEHPVTLPTPNDGSYEIITALNQFGQDYVTQNGTLSKLMVASLSRAHQNGENICFSGIHHYIAFEMPSNISPNETTLLHNVVLDYSQQKQSATQKDCLFIGNPSNPRTNTVEYMQSMQDYVDTNIGIQIKQFQEEENQKRQLEQFKIDNLHRQQEEDFFNRNFSKFEKQNEVRLNRINHPYIHQHGTQNYVAQDGKTYNDYNAVNVKSGDILKIRKLNKVGMDPASGRYLYTRLYSKYI